VLWLVRRTPVRNLIARPLLARWTPAYAIGGLAAFWLIERISTAVGGAG
jgi:hypothetical protein